MNILIIRLKSIGDVLFTLPAVHVIRENFPRAKLYFLVNKENAGLLRGFSDIDEIIPLDRAIYRSRNLCAISAATLNLLRGLRQPRFSLAIDFHGHGETGFLTWWSGAPERWGGIKHDGQSWIYTRHLQRIKNLHPAERNLALLEQGGLKTGTIQNEYALPMEALLEATQLFSNFKLDTARPILFIQPFTSSPHKNWPLANFLKLAWHWQSQGGQVIFGGGPADRAVLEPAREAGFCVSAGASLLVSAGLVKQSALTIGGDTGLLHLAVAMGKRVIMLMQSNAPGQTHPFQHPDWTMLPSSGKSVAEIELGAVIERCGPSLDKTTG